MRRVVVIGAGAAGTMAAIFAASAGADVLLLERTKDGGRKILISGGGRCNILPARVDESRFVTHSSPQILRTSSARGRSANKSPSSSTSWAFPCRRAESGKLFPESESARDVRDTLLAYAASQGVWLLAETLVTGFAPSASGWQIDRQGAAPASRRCDRCRNRRPLGPQHRKRWTRPYHRRDAGPYGAPDISRADASHGPAEAGRRGSVPVGAAIRLRCRSRSCRASRFR